MIDIIKIEGGLRWDDKEKFFTYIIFESGYELIDTNHISIELDEQIYCLGADSVTIDGDFCLDSQDLVNKIF